MKELNDISKQTSRFRASLTVKMFTIGFLILILLIPLFFIQNLIQERAYRKESTINEINKKWGSNLILSGPIVKIPYIDYIETIKIDDNTQKTFHEKVAKTQYAYFLPEKLNIDTKADAIKKGYSIYETSVYNAQINANGLFTLPLFSKDIPKENILWDQAIIMIQTTNLKGIKNEVTLKLGDSTLKFMPRFMEQQNNNVSTTFQTLESDLLTASLFDQHDAIPFSFTMSVKGSKGIHFIPIGKETIVDMKSNWKAPSFNGNFLPEEDSTSNIDENGFKAHWNIFHTNRQFEQQFFGHLPDVSEFSFGVELIVPLDEYQKSERSTKYGLMIISLTFLVFFIIQAVSKINIHPFQYLMIGLALTMFYTLLISISEHESFLKGYLIAGIAVVTLISLYTKSVLKMWKFSLLVFCSLSSLYTFVFVIIQLENYALLVGSIGLFIILSLVMYFSRKIDWSNN